MRLGLLLLTDFGLPCEAIELVSGAAVDSGAGAAASDILFAGTIDADTAAGSDPVVGWFSKNANTSATYWPTHS